MLNVYILSHASSLAFETYLPSSVVFIGIRLRRAINTTESWLIMFSMGLRTLLPSTAATTTKMKRMPSLDVLLPMPEREGKIEKAEQESQRFLFW